jgi:hypothetical protein
MRRSLVRFRWAATTPMVQCVTSTRRTKKLEAGLLSIEIHDSSTIERGEIWYFLAFGDLKVNLNEQKLLELFEPLERP